MAITTGYIVLERVSDNAAIVAAGVLRMQPHQPLERSHLRMHLPALLSSYRGLVQDGAAAIIALPQQA